MFAKSNKFTRDINFKNFKRFKITQRRTATNSPTYNDVNLTSWFREVKPNSNEVFHVPQNSLNLTMYGSINKKQEYTNKEQFSNSIYNMKSKYDESNKGCISVQGQRAKARINTSFDTKANISNRFKNNVINKVNMNDSFNVQHQNLFGNNFMTSNAIRLTPRQLNKKFGNFMTKLN